MRELKFRVWDKDLAKYLEGCEIDSLMAEFSSEGDGRGIVIKQICPARYKFEQYTGLKDRNGKEIYEGDIVQIDSIDELRVGYVDLLYDQYCIVCGEDDEGRKNVAEFYYYSKPEENCKVIGNVNENPELLDGINVTNKEEG